MIIPNSNALNNQLDDSVLTKAFFRAGEILAFSRKELARILGISEASLSRLARRQSMLSPEARDGEIALAFLRIFRSLDALLGGREADMRLWFDSPHRYLGMPPRERVKSLEGLFDVVTYLDAMRGQV